MKCRHMDWWRRKKKGDTIVFLVILSKSHAPIPTCVIQSFFTLLAENNPHHSTAQHSWLMFMVPNHKNNAVNDILLCMDINQMLVDKALRVSCYVFTEILQIFYVKFIFSSIWWGGESLGSWEGEMLNC